MGEGLGHGSGDDHDRGLRRPSARRAPAAPGARGDGRRDHGRVPPALRPAAGPTPALDRDAAARVRPGAACRPHTPGCGDCADLHPTRPRARARRHSAPRRSGSTTSAPASTCHVASPSSWRTTRRRARCCSSVTASSRGGQQATRATAPRSSSSPEPQRPSRRQGTAASASAVPRSRSCGKGTVDPPSSRVPCPHSAARSSPTPTASCWRSTRARPQSPSPRPCAVPRSARSARPAPTT